MAKENKTDNTEERDSVPLIIAFPIFGFLGFFLGRRYIMVYLAVFLVFAVAMIGVIIYVSSNSNKEQDKFLDVFKKSQDRVLNDMKKNDDFFDDFNRHVKF